MEGGSIFQEGVEYQGISAQTIQSLFVAMMNATYPVGCYFETTDTNFNPNNEFVGTWELEDEGLVHISAGSTKLVTSNDKDGGSETISYTPSGSTDNFTLQETHLPKLSASAYFRRTSGNGDCVFSATGKFSRATVSSSNTSYNQIASSTSTYRDQLNWSIGGGTAHKHGFTGTQATLNVMQPYKIVNRWHRTA